MLRSDWIVRHAKVLAWRCNHHRRTGDGPCKVCGYACPFVSQDGYVIQPAKCDDVQAKDWEKILTELEEEDVAFPQN